MRLLQSALLSIAAGLGCATSPRSISASKSSSEAEIVAATADTIIALVAPPKSPTLRLFVADGMTAQAVGHAAERAGYSISSTSALVLCAGPAGENQVIGLLLDLTLASLTGDRAEVGWSATCHLTPRGEFAPLAFGPFGTLEVRRTAGRWRVTKMLSFFER